MAFESASRTVWPGLTCTIVRCSLGRYARTTDFRGDRGGGGIAIKGGTGACWWWPWWCPPPSGPNPDLRCGGNSASEQSSNSWPPGLCRPLDAVAALTLSMSSCSRALNSCNLLVNSLYSYWKTNLKSFLYQNKMSKKSTGGYGFVQRQLVFGSKTCCTMKHL